MNQSNLSPEKMAEWLDDVRSTFEEMGQWDKSDEDMLAAIAASLRAHEPKEDNKLAEVLQAAHNYICSRRWRSDGADYAEVQAICGEITKAIRSLPSAEPKEEPVAWISDESLRRLKDGGNSRGSVPVHSKPSGFSHIPLLIARGQQLETAERKPTALCTCMGFARHPQECTTCTPNEMKDQWICACKLTDARQCASEQRITAATCACECHRL